MRVYWAIALFVALGTSFSAGQQTISAPSSQTDAQPARVKVYTVGPDVTAPELLPVNAASIPDEKCKNKEDGKVTLSVLVDASGEPRNLTFLKPLGSALDRLAFEAVAADRFKPGTRDGAPVVVAQSVEVDIREEGWGGQEDSSVAVAGPAGAAIGSPPGVAQGNCS